jgi:CRP-like cAMP-binding protein
MPTYPHDRLIRKLESIYPISDDDRRVLNALPLQLREVPENSDVVREGQRPEYCCLLVDGFLCRYKILGDGERQIFSFHIPGDVPDLQSLHLHVMDHSLGTLTPCQVAQIPHSVLHALVRERPNLAAAFWRDTLIDAAVFREWLAGVGRRSATQRIAHLFCEVFVRLRAVGLADGLSFQLPITQSEMADALGLSTVHVNRVLQELKSAGLISYRGADIRIEDWKRLEEAGEFDPGYLHLKAA